MLVDRVVYRTIQYYTLGMSTPTHEFYGFLQQAYDFYNRRLFAGALPYCLITAQRERNTMGYFSPERWASPDGQRAHEIAINPAYFAGHKVIEIFQTLVHEQCHLWQFEYGQHKSRRGYHNKEWAEKMQSVGLMPSDTSEAGGRTTGQRVSDYPLEGGAFIEACKALLGDGFQVPWVDRHPAIKVPCQNRQGDDGIAESLGADTLYINVSALIPDLEVTETLQHAARTKQKVRYHCSGCHANLWGKPGLDVICGSCDQPFQGDPQ